MPFGSGPFGATAFGADPPTFGPDYQRAAPPPAVYFDPLTREFLLDADGRYRNMGTVEQQVALAFSAPRGALTYAPEVGHDFMKLPRVHGAKLDAEIDRRARLATPFDTLLAAGTVEFVGAVEIQHPKDTETRMLIRWRKTGEAAGEETDVVTR